jgi:hypothetical protein
MPDELEIDLDPTPEQAVWANRLARQLVTARVGVLREDANTRDSDAFRVWARTIGQAMLDLIPPGPLPPVAVKRITYLISALSLVASIAVGMAGALYARIPGEDRAGVDPEDIELDDEAIQEMMQTVALLLDQSPWSI